MSLPQGIRNVDITPNVLGYFTALQTLRIDEFNGFSGAGITLDLLASIGQRPGTAQLQHLALHQLTVPPYSQQLGDAITQQCDLQVRRLPTLLVQMRHAGYEDWCN